MVRGLKLSMSRRCKALLVLPVLLLTVSLSDRGVAVERLEPQAAAEVDLFAAEKAGHIEVQFIPQDATKANVLVKNLTDKPLHIRLPEAFAAVPINAQMGGYGGGMGGMGGGMGGMGGMGMGGMGGGMGGGQAMGGGMGGMGGGMGGMGGGYGGGGGMGMGGMMRVAPEKMQKAQVVTVCLEHGKPDPTPKMAYKMVPLERFSSDPRISQVCAMLGRGQLTQNTAQAAAWHLTDDLSWQQLAMKNRVESRYTGNIRWFSPAELHQALAVVNYVNTQAKASSVPYGSDQSAPAQADPYASQRYGAQLAPAEQFVPKQ